MCFFGDASPAVVISVVIPLGVLKNT